MKRVYEEWEKKDIRDHRATSIVILSLTIALDQWARENI